MQRSASTGTSIERWALVLLAALAGCGPEELELATDCPRSLVRWCDVRERACQVELHDYYLCLAERPPAEAPPVELLTAPPEDHAGAWPAAASAFEVELSALGVWRDGRGRRPSASVSLDGAQVRLLPAVDVGGWPDEPLVLVEAFAVADLVERYGADEVLAIRDRVDATLVRDAAVGGVANLYRTMVRAGIQGGSFWDYPISEGPISLEPPTSLSEVETRFAQLADYRAGLAWRDGQTSGVQAWLQAGLAGDRASTIGDLYYDRATDVTGDGPVAPPGYAERGQLELGPDAARAVLRASFGDSAGFVGRVGDRLVAYEREADARRALLWRCEAGVSEASTVPLEVAGPARVVVADRAIVLYWAEDRGDLEGLADAARAWAAVEWR